MKKLSVQDVDRCVNEKQNSDSGEMQTKASSRSQIVVTQDSVLKAADTRKARELLTGWGHEPVSGAIKEVSQALTTARESERGRCALIADLWGAGISCRSHDDDPCCHIRTGREIAARIRATSQPEDGRQTTIEESHSQASESKSSSESESTLVQVDEVSAALEELREMFPDRDVSVHVDDVAYWQKRGYPRGETPSTSHYFYTTIRVGVDGQRVPFKEFGGRDVPLSEAMSKVREWKKEQDNAKS